MTDDGFDALSSRLDIWPGGGGSHRRPLAVDYHVTRQAVSTTIRRSSRSGPTALDAFGPPPVWLSTP